MDKITIMLNGLPGRVSQVICGHLIKDERFSVLPYSLTGPEIDAPSCTVADLAFHLIAPQVRDQTMADLVSRQGPLICVDYSHPSAVNSNAEFYCRHGLPFVMGTTGGDRRRLTETVRDSTISAVIAPNMVKQIVAFQAMMAYAAENFPDVFKGYSLHIHESHQAGKADTSGTAKAMVTYFNGMGIPFTADQILMERDPERQLNLWGIPAEHLQGHAWHTYTLTSPDHSVLFEFKHNINGRDVYAPGTMDAIIFLARKIAAGAVGQVYSMVDVLKQGSAA